MVRGIEAWHAWVEQAEKPIDTPRQMACLSLTPPTMRILARTEIHPGRSQAGLRQTQFLYNRGLLPLPRKSIHHHSHNLSTAISFSVAPTIVHLLLPSRNCFVILTRKMSYAPRIPNAQWDAHKKQIRALYLVEDKTLDQTIEIMRERYGFSATLVPGSK